MQLSDLLHAASNLFRSPSPMQTYGRERMVIPCLQDTRNERMKDKVDGQCRECSRLLASHLFVWRKPFPEKPTLKSWSKEGLCFQGMEIQVFSDLIMERYTVVTEDNRRWLLDRSIAALIWNSCCDPDSPLPLASWQEETSRKRKEARK
jgi:hypothetical protein